MECVAVNQKIESGMNAIFLQKNTFLSVHSFTFKIDLVFSSYSYPICLLTLFFTSQFTHSVSYFFGIFLRKSVYMKTFSLKRISLYI